MARVGRAGLRAIAEVSGVAAEIAHLLVKSEGNRGAEATYGKLARWCGFHARTAPNGVEGLAIMEHPENSWQPCPWFTRDYRNRSPSPFAFLKQPWTQAKGKSIRLRYRVVM